MKNSFIFLAVIAFVASYFAGKYLSQQNHTGLSTKELSYQPCDLSNKNTCSAQLNGSEVNVAFLQAPSSLSPFEIVVEVGDLNAEQVILDFRMEGMDMGINKYNMKKKDNGRWVTQAVLPVCSLGRNDWIVELQVVNDNILWTAEYSFQQ